MISYKILFICMFIWLAPMLLFCNDKKPKAAMDQLIEELETQLKTKDTTKCKNGKRYSEVNKIEEDKRKKKRKLIEKIGLPDTVFMDTLDYPCSTYVYICEKKYVGFHYKLNSKYFGTSTGVIDSGKFIQATACWEIP